MIEVKTQDFQQAKGQSLFSINVPANTISSLVREFSLKDNEIESFITSLLEKSIMEHASAANSAVFSESETKELEEDLRGLGYI
ncbi:MAG: hypothetical protein ABI361_02505 [Nitrososphaera sp.]|jgi:hypothetical protein